jgi:hypothetical protein
LPELHFYQLAIPAPAPEPGVDFDAAAAERGDELFSGKAKCNEKTDLVEYLKSLPEE